MAQALEKEAPTPLGQYTAALKWWKVGIVAKVRFVLSVFLSCV